MCVCLQGVFDHRMKTWQKWQDSQLLLQKKREAEAKLQCTNKPDKLQQAKDEITEVRGSMSMQHKGYCSPLFKRRDCLFFQCLDVNHQDKMIDFLSRNLHFLYCLFYCCFVQYLQPNQKQRKVTCNKSLNQANIHSFLASSIFLNVSSLCFSVLYLIIN